MTAPVLPTDPWALLTEAECLSLINNGIPDTAALSLMKTDLFTDGFTRSDTTGTVGMFGYENFYFFYLKFSPSKSIVNSGDKINVWF